MGSNNLTIATAFLGGLFSFLSPCVLPLVPGYLSLISGLSLEQLRDHSDRKPLLRSVTLNTFAFVVGFSVVFVSLGASATGVGRILQSHLPALSKVAGIIIILFGLHVSGLVKINALYREMRFHSRTKPRGLTGAFLMGLAFAFGWTPCIGPILAAILALAAAQESIARGTILLATYSLGLGIPFLLTGIGTNFFLTFYQNVKRYVRGIEIASGLLLIALGTLILTSSLGTLSRYLTFLPDLSPSAQPTVTVPHAPERRAAPDIHLPTLDGHTVSLASLKGKVVVLNFWATWCGPCVQEIPVFNKLLDQYSDKGLVIIGLAVQSGDAEDVRSFAAKHPMNYIIATGDESVEKEFGGITGLPTTLLIDKEGNIRIQYRGLIPPQTFEEEIAELLREAL